MFKPGYRYVITTLEAEVGAEVQKWAVFDVDKVDGPLISGRFADGRVVVLNTLSPKFVRAELIIPETVAPLVDTLPTANKRGVTERTSSFLFIGSVIVLVLVAAYAARRAGS